MAQIVLTCAPGIAQTQNSLLQLLRSRILEALRSRLAQCLGRKKCLTFGFEFSIDDSNLAVANFLTMSDRIDRSRVRIRRGNQQPFVALPLEFEALSPADGKDRCSITCLALGDPSQWCI